MTEPTYVKGMPIPRWKYHPPQLRCGLCDEEFETGESTTVVDDERVHRACARGEREVPYGEAA